MKTPGLYARNLKKGIITRAMIEDALYSANKRAKNWRDQKRKIIEIRRLNRYFTDKYDHIGEAERNMEKYYGEKDILTGILKPVCIHREFAGYERWRIYDWQDEYRKYCRKFVYENCYYDQEEEREIWFGDVELLNRPMYRYYLYYSLGGNHSFHQPIDEKDVLKSQLSVVDIDTLETYGAARGNLLSAQFTAKLTELVKSGQFSAAEDLKPYLRDDQKEEECSLF